MIAKRIIRKQAASFKGLGAYILAEQNGGRGDPVDWKLSEYLLDHAHSGEKVAWAHATNCKSDDLGFAVKEILAIQARNKTAKTDKSYHLVVSFPEEERPAREQIEDIEAELCMAIGLAEHQRIAAVHQNTDNWHLHVAINRVHPTTRRAVEPYYDHLRLQEACQVLEIKHNLTRDNHSLKPEKSLKGRPAAMEAHAGRMSFARWVTENAAAPLLAAAAQATTWQELHLAATKCGVEIKPRGAGLIVANIGDNRARIKASTVGPVLSFKALVDRFGSYEPPPGTVREKAPAMRYDGRPTGASPDLWARYQQERAQATEARAAALASLRAGHLRYGQEMEAWHKKRYANAAAQVLSLANKKSTYRSLDADRATDRARRKVVEKEDRQKVRDQHTLPTWPAFLAREIAHGNEPAVKALDRLVSKQIEREGQGAGRD
jgi:Relaxase/Mobilisation nuclease domain